MIILLNFAPTLGSAADFLEVRGAVAGTVNGASNLADNTFTWNLQNFAGFFYDIKKDLGTETLKFVLTEGNRLSGDNPYGVTYTTTVQNKAFERRLWGSYKIIGFQAEKYFAGYNHGVDEQSGSDILYAESTDKNSLSSEQLEKILIDAKDEMTFTSDTSLKLEEGYELAIKSIDIDSNNGNKVYLDLSKNGAVVDRKVISPSKDGATEADKTYYYKDPAVGEQKKLVTIGVHFKNAFRGADSNQVTIDGEWQISDTPMEVRADTTYDKMTIRTVDATAGTITMENKDNAITLSRNNSISLMPGISIRTADSGTLRFFIYKLINESGDHEIRGAVAGIVNGESNLPDNSFTWNPQNFAGFFYDIGKDLGTETMKLVLTENNKLSGDEPYGVTYTTTAQNKMFEYGDWGYYNVIVFRANEYFASYSQSGTSSELLDEANSTNLLESGQVTKVLIDDGQEKVIDLGSTIVLAEGYALKPTLGTDKKGILVELLHDGKVVDREALILPSSYVYISKAVNTTGVPVIAAHFQEPIILDDKSYCKVDGLWQLSEKTTDIKVDTQYDKMTIRSVDASAGIITMDNKDNSITLSKNKDLVLAGDLGIKTADNDSLRFYLYKTAKIVPAGVSK